MRKIEGYQCEICGTILIEEKHAKECEQSHVNCKELKIVDGYFRSRDNLIDSNVWIPDSLKVQFTEKEKPKDSIFGKSFIATYKLEKFKYID